MKYQELHIETRRETPARARTIGEALLLRAGYITSEGNPTLLGQRVITHLQTMEQSPQNLFTRLGLRVYETSHAEVFFEVSGGDFHILRCPVCGYASIPDLAKTRKPSQPAEPMLPLLRVLTPDCSTIESLSKFLGIAKDRTAKALMYNRLADGQFVFVVLRGDTQISERKLRDVVGETEPASPVQVASAGAVAGYASPIGLRDALVVVDELVSQSTNLVAGANELGFHLKNTNCGRDYTPQHIADLTLSKQGDPCERCGTPLGSTIGFLLFGNGVFRFENILLALAEQHHDAQGLSLPGSAAPFLVYLMNIPSKTVDTRGQSDKLYHQLETAGLPVLYDDREQRAGIKFHDADLIGCPIRITLSERNLNSGMVEWKPRQSVESRLVQLDNIVQLVQSASISLQ